VNCKRRGFAYCFCYQENLFLKLGVNFNPLPCFNNKKLKLISIHLQQYLSYIKNINKKKIGTGFVFLLTLFFLMLTQIHSLNTFNFPQQASINSLLKTSKSFIDTNQIIQQINLITNSPQEFQINPPDYLKEDIDSFNLFYTNLTQLEIKLLMAHKELYFPTIKKIFEENNIPSELSYLTISLSCLNNNQSSDPYCSGIWQIPYFLGIALDLTIDLYTDERMIIEKSTQAVANYFLQLYDQYNDWNLVILAYVCGVNNMNKIFDTFEGQINPDSIYYNLPQEKRCHLPAFYSSRFFFSRFLMEEKNLNPIITENETLIVEKEIHLKQVAEVLKIPYYQLAFLNPQYRLV